MQHIGLSLRLCLSRSSVVCWCVCVCVYYLNDSHVAWLCVIIIIYVVVAVVVVVTWSMSRSYTRLSASFSVLVDVAVSSLIWSCKTSSSIFSLEIITIIDNHHSDVIVKLQALTLHCVCLPTNRLSSHSLRFVWRTRTGSDYHGPGQDGCSFKGLEHICSRLGLGQAQKVYRLLL